MTLLGAPNWRMREAAQKRLTPAVPMFVEKLHELERDSDAEVRRRASVLLDRYYAENAATLSCRLGQLPHIMFLPKGYFRETEEEIEHYLTLAYTALAVPRTVLPDQPWIGPTTWNHEFHPEKVQREATRQLMEVRISTRQPISTMLASMKRSEVSMKFWLFGEVEMKKDGK